LRRSKLARRKLEQDLKEAEAKGDEFKAEELQIDLDENLYGRANMEKTARDRVRELKLWSQIKKELDDGSFDTTYVNTHQAESYVHNLQNRVNSLNANSQPAETLPSNCFNFPSSVFNLFKVSRGPAALTISAG
jgi:hypothetical protein